MTPGPYCICAVFCEHVIEAKDSTISAIRIIDTVALSVADDKQPPPAPGPGTRTGAVFAVDFNYLVTLKSGDFRGRGKMRIDIHSPTKKLGSKDFEVDMFGGEKGHNVILRGALPPEDGLFWFEVYFNDRLLTRTPLAVRIESGSPTMTTDPQKASQSSDTQ